MSEIIPGILEKNWGEIASKLEIAKSFARSIHVDIIDGKFALASPTGGPNVTFLDPTPFAKYSQDFLLELHMMVENPIQYLESFAKAGFKRFIGHIEMMPDQTEFVTKAKEFGEVGLAVDGPTPLENIKIPFSGLDCVLIMTVKAGASGQVFNSECLKKIETLQSSFAKASADKQVQIEVDGGINDQTVLLAKAAGATRFIANSFLFNKSDPEAQFNILKRIISA